MKIRILLAVVAMLGISNIAMGDEVDSRFRVARKYLDENNLTVTTTIDQAYVQDAILVVGEGLGKKGTVGAQKRLTAITAAKVAAQRRLAELLHGVAVVSETTVRDSELESDVIKTAVTGLVRGAQPVIQEYNEREETALVILKVGMNGPRSFAATLYEKILTEPKVRQELEKPAYVPPVADVAPAVAGSYDGLIIDATGYNFRPALINRIFNPRGEVLYDPAKISQKVLVEQGCGEYTNSVDKARAALGKRGVRNPLVVTAAGTVSPSDLQVADDMAAQIFAANQASGFMADARVAFVLK
ncbi:MAG TPA: hypothetical protein PLN25_05445 [Deltaproteobacteria bacterium]|nr:hypothetical protein [Deltaproteobacteria bacterium]HQB39173.1 hypothetical protein [Deltaproteobacteria bacterium]